MEDPVNAKRPCERAKQRPLGIVSNIGGRKCRYLPSSQSRGGVNNGGTVGEWLVDV